jgi:hypothetical protein
MSVCDDAASITYDCQCPFSWALQSPFVCFSGVALVVGSSVYYGPAFQQEQYRIGFGAGAHFTM